MPNVQIGYIKSPAIRGDRVTVYFDNNKFATFIAANDLVSSKVAVIGDRVFSEDESRLLLSQTTELYKSQTTISETGCQLVAASICLGNIDVNVLDRLPYNTFPENTAVVLDRPVISWLFDSISGYCQAFSDGRGEYDTAEECLAANQRSDFLYPTYQPSKAVDGYVYHSSGLLVTSGTGSDAISDKQYKIRERLFYVSPTDNPRVIRTEFGYVPGNKAKLKSYFVDDGIVRYRRGGSDSLVPFPVSEFEQIVRFEKDGRARATYQKERIVSLSELVDYVRSSIEVDPRESSNYDSNFRTVNPPRDADFDSINQNRVDFNITYHRNVVKRYSSNRKLQTYFLKVHDPDLPPIILYEIHPNLYHKSYFVFEGTKAYLILKIGRVRNPDVSLDERKFFQIKVVEVSVKSDRAEVVEVKEYQHDTHTEIDRTDFILAPYLSFFEDRDLDLPCLSGYEFDLDSIGNQRFRETSYQLSGGQLIEYKLEGYIVGVID